MEPTALVREAAARFAKGDDEGFVACFEPAVRIYSEPELSAAPFVSSRTELTKAVQRSERLRQGEAKLLNVEQHGGGVIADLIIVPPENRNAGAWRFALAIRISHDLIGEVRPFWQRDAALGSLLLID
jgi:hypothetical protein